MPSAPAPFPLGDLPIRRFRTVDEHLVRCPLAPIFSLAARVDEWPRYLAHYRYVRVLEHRVDGGGIVEMSANRPFGRWNWPTRWTSEMAVSPHGEPGDGPWVRFRHIRGVTRGMEVEWSFAPSAEGTLVRIVHVWDGPGWPLVGDAAAQWVIGPVFVHGIASRTLAGLGAAAERGTSFMPGAR